MFILTILTLVILVVFLLVAVFYLIQQIRYSTDSSRIVFLPSSTNKIGLILSEIIQKYVDKTENYSLFEPGSGVANVSRFLAKKYRWKEIIAVESEWLTFQMAKLLLLFNPNKVQILQQDIFEMEFPTPAVIYCYLSPTMMERLLAEGKFAGNLVISQTFRLKNVQPVEEIVLTGFQKRILVYDFRA